MDEEGPHGTEAANYQGSHVFADLTVQTMFGVQEGGQGDRGREVLGLA